MPALKDLVWYDRLHFVAMLLMAAAVPVSFHCGLWAGMLLGAASVVKMVAQRRVGNRSLSKASLIAYGAVVLYWLIYLVSLTRGGDVHEGVQVLIRKAVLLIFASCFLLTDTSYLKEKHFRWLFYALWGSVCLVFLYFVGKGVSKLLAGAPLEKVCGMEFDPRDYAYVALYINTAISFIYVELSSRWNALRKGLRIAFIASIPCLILYVMTINSRSGVLGLWIVAITSVLHLAFFKRKWKIALLVALLFGGYTMGLSNILPGHTDRIAKTVETVTKSEGKEDKPTDARIYINKSSAELAIERFWFGYGVGNYRELLSKQYGQNGYESGVKKMHNAHNQYMETMLAVGIFGLLFLLTFLLTPLWQAWRKRKDLLLVLLFTTLVCFSLLFESMLERQMGLQFIGYFMSLMVLLGNLGEMTPYALCNVQETE